MSSYHRGLKCPSCNSNNVYFRSKSEEIVCRACKVTSLQLKEPQQPQQPQEEPKKRCKRRKHRKPMTSYFRKKRSIARLKYLESIRGVKKDVTHDVTANKDTPLILLNMLIHDIVGYIKGVWNEKNETKTKGT